MDKKDVKMIFQISEALNHLSEPIIHFASKKPSEISDILHELAQHQPNLLLSLHQLIKNVAATSENMKKGFNLAMIIEEAKKSLSEQQRND